MVTDLTRTLVTVFVWVLVSFGLYLKGVYDANQQWETKLRDLENLNLQQLREQEFSMVEKQQKLEAKYLQDIDTLKKEHEDEISKLTADKLRDTTNCMPDTSSISAGVSKKTKAKSNLICYTRAELLGKIQKSMDITRECDELAIKYKTLLKVCKEK